jgi:hypothetical protein
MPIAGAVANRVTQRLWDGDVLPTGYELAEGLRPGETELAERLAITLAEHELLARADAREAGRLFAAVRDGTVAVPRLEKDVHDLAGLALLAAAL